MGRLRSNDACWCGNGKKLKRCHGAFERPRQPVAPGVVGPLRQVPPGLIPPDYVATDGWPAERAGLQILNDSEIARLRIAGRIAAEVLLEAGAHVAPGITTDELDEIVHEGYISRGAFPSTLGYKGFSKSCCTSVNEVVCHGIPDSRPLVEGDIVNIDVTAFAEGMHGDTSATFAVGRISLPVEALVEATCRATMLGIGAVKAGATLADIGAAIEDFTDTRGLGVVRDYGGHGIGTVFHAEPHVGHTRQRGRSLPLQVGMTFTVEPMITAGTYQHDQWDDGWTEVTADLLPTAQFEHTVVVTPDGADIMTLTATGDTAVRWPNAAAVTQTT
jgi:methionyl aminopeptidase